jgi:hypothetical protein
MTIRQQVERERLLVLLLLLFAALTLSFFLG